MAARALAALAVAMICLGVALAVTLLERPKASLRGSAPARGPTEAQVAAVTTAAAPAEPTEAQVAVVTTTAAPAEPSEAQVAAVSTTAAPAEPSEAQVAAVTTTAAPAEPTEAQVAAVSTTAAPAEPTEAQVAAVSTTAAPAEPSEAQVAAVTTTAAPAEPTEAKCYSMYSQLAMNELQIYAGNPDSKASGYASFTLCTNGTLSGTAVVFGGVSEIIATHIHHCKGGDTPQTRTADLCEGPPVINFCGSNAAGLIADGVEYPEACAPYGGAGASRTSGMRGVLVPAQNKGMTVADRVTDIAENPQSYFFNVHTAASWNQWYPAPKGSCRGAMQL